MEDTSPPPPVEGRPAPVRAAPVGAGGAPNWQAFIDAVMKKRPLLGALLSHGEFRLEAGKKITLAFPVGSFYERQAMDSKNRNDIQDLLKQFYGSDISFSLASAENVRSPEKSREEEAARMKKDALEHPSVVQMKEALGAEVVDVNVEV